MALIIVGIGTLPFSFLACPQDSEKKWKNRYSALAMVDTPPHLEQEAIYSDPARDWFHAGIQALKEKDYGRAVINLREADRVSPNKPLIQYYLGVSCLLHEQINEAIPLLEASQKDAEKSLKDDALWYLGNAYLKAGNIEPARRTFEILAAYLNEQQRNARTLLKKMEEMQKKG